MVHLLFLALASASAFAEASPTCTMNWNLLSEGKWKKTFVLAKPRTETPYPNFSVSIDKKGKSFSLEILESSPGKIDSIAYGFQCERENDCHGQRTIQSEKTKKVEQLLIVAGPEIEAKIGGRPIFRYHRSGLALRLYFSQYASAGIDYGMNLECHEK